MLPKFIESRFPSLTGWDYSSEASYQVGIAESGQGARENRNLPTPYPRRRITVRIAPDKEGDMSMVKRWHHALRGSAVGFRVMDPTDFLSVDMEQFQSVDTFTAALCTALDQPLEEIEETPGGFQLVKQYTVEIADIEDLTQRLPILKPVQGTILVANHLGQVQPPDRWVIDYTRGILQPGGGFVGTPYTWGGQYDVPMRFNSPLPVEMTEHRFAGTTFELLELPRGDFL